MSVITATSSELVPETGTIAIDVRTNGFAMVQGLLSPGEICALRNALDELASHSHGARNLLQRSAVVRGWARSKAILDVVRDALRGEPFAVCAILFDKTPATNWKVTWHQDLAIPVRERRDVPGFGPWSVKAGVHHVQPPVEVLENMLTVRLHLDDCGQENGPLRVIPGSHSHGVMDEASIQTWRVTQPEISCIANAGDALLMRPLLMHASSPAINPNRRRVLHLEFAASALPAGLEWAAA